MVHKRLKIFRKIFGRLGEAPESVAPYKLAIEIAVRRGCDFGCIALLHKSLCRRSHLAGAACVAQSASDGGGKFLGSAYRNEQSRLP